VQDPTAGTNEDESENQAADQQVTADESAVDSAMPDQDNAEDAGQDVAEDAGQDVAEDAGQDVAEDAGQDVAGDARQGVTGDAGQAPTADNRQSSAAAALQAIRERPYSGGNAAWFAKRIGITRR
jgi:hypothetical protein